MNKQAIWGNVPLQAMSRRVCVDTIRTINHPEFNKGSFKEPTLINGYTWTEWRNMLNTRVFKIDQAINMQNKANALLSKIGEVERIFDVLVKNNMNKTIN